MNPFKFWKKKKQRYGSQLPTTWERVLGFGTAPHMDSLSETMTTPFVMGLSCSITLSLVCCAFGSNSHWFPWRPSSNLPGRYYFQEPAPSCIFGFEYLWIIWMDLCITHMLICSSLPVSGWVWKRCLYSVYFFMELHSPWFPFSHCCQFHLKLRNGRLLVLVLGFWLCEKPLMGLIVICE